ncbi:MAG: hypothetical protein GTO46_15190 [Gemmatimonadetes bacterium]|nr:hypothetical protein [Gemmatimonadota bacterium]NIO32983.1 hypothetical protein [Gemmatimonadota bacterium]
MKRERETQGLSYAYEKAVITNPQFAKDNYSVLAAGLANWAAFLNVAEKPTAAEEIPVNTPRAELLAEGFSLALQEQQEKWA